MKEKENKAKPRHLLLVIFSKLCIPVSLLPRDEWVHDWGPACVAAQSADLETGEVALGLPHAPLSWAEQSGGDKGLQAWRPHLLILMVLHRPGHCLPLQRPTFRKGVSIAYSCADWQQGATVRFRLGQGRRSTLHFLGSWHLKCILCPSGGERGEGRARRLSHILPCTIMYISYVVNFNVDIFQALPGNGQV